MTRRLAGGLVAVALLGASSAVADDVVVRLVDDQFEPAEIVLEHGKSYRLRLVNAGKELHEFNAPAFFRAAQVKDGASALTPNGAEVVLQPGQTAELELVAPAPGSYQLTCPDHDWEGMVGTIVVR